MSEVPLYSPEGACEGFAPRDHRKAPLTIWSVFVEGLKGGASHARSQGWLAYRGDRHIGDRERSQVARVPRTLR